MAYDLAWLSTATFADLDAAMSNIITRREVEPLLRTQQGAAIAKRLIETRSVVPALAKTAYGIEWLRTANYAQLSAALKDINARPQIELLLRTVEGAKIASQLINDTRVVPPADEPVSEEEQAAIDADNARAEEQVAADQQVGETVAQAIVETPAKTVVELPKVKIVRDYQVEDEQGKPLGRRTHIEGWTNEEIFAKYEAAHTNAVRYAERLKKRLDLMDQATKTQQSAAVAAAEADQAIVAAKKENDPIKFTEAVKKTSVAERETEAAKRAAAQYASIIIESWMDDHKEDYVPCEASADLLNQWMGQNGLQLSYENLEKAFQATKAKQPIPERRAAQTSAAPVTNPQAAAVVAPVAQAASITQPAAEATAQGNTANPSATSSAATAQAQTTTSANAGQSATARRPGVNGGLQPNAASARPVKQQPSAQTDRAALMKEIRSLSPSEYRTKVEKSEEFRQRLKAAGIVDAGVR
jgi:hypothetical protein